MLSNNTMTYYHKTLNTETRLENWNRYLFENVWAFGSNNASVNVGYENSNNVEVRIPIELVEDTSIFQLGDIISIGNNAEILTQDELVGKEFYNVTSIKINNFGSTPHVHLGGR